jgi:hypothetical protein
MIMDYYKLKEMEEKVESLMSNKDFLRIFDEDLNEEIIIKREPRSYLKKGYTENVIKYIACGQWEEYSMFCGSITNKAYEAIMNYTHDTKLIEMKVNKNAIELTFSDEEFISDFIADVKTYLKFELNSQKNDIHILLYQELDVNLQVMLIKKLVDYYNNDLTYKCEYCNGYEYIENKEIYQCEACGKNRCEECRNKHSVNVLDCEETDIEYFCEDCQSNID